MDDIKTICASVQPRSTCLCAGPFTKYSKPISRKVGAARISIGRSAGAATHRVVLEAGHAMLDDGDFTHLGEKASVDDEIDRMLERRRRGLGFLRNTPMIGPMALQLLCEKPSASIAETVPSRNRALWVFNSS